MIRKLNATIFIISMSTFLFSAALVNPRMVTYGPKAPGSEGDDDHFQVIFILIPQSITEDLNVRLFDADCGGIHDTVIGVIDTETRFTLYGGDNVFSHETSHLSDSETDDLGSGTVINTQTYQIASELDNEWSNFATIHAKDGELVGAYRVFKLVVEGLQGDDGNIFDVFLSIDPRQNIACKGVKLHNYAPTFRLDGEGALELRFIIPATTQQLVISNYDAAKARITLETSYRSIAVRSSDQGQAIQTQISLTEEDKGLAALVLYDDGLETPNDATFYIKDEKGNSLPLEWPAFRGLPNHRPQAVVSTEALADCTSIALDGSKSTDEDGDILTFHWDFGDGQTATGQKVVHQFLKPGFYQGQLKIQDSSLWVGNSAIKKFDLVLNNPPQAKMHVDLVGVPGLPLTFSGLPSVDTDGSILRYLWEFGDGTQGKGAEVSHIFKKPGRYSVSMRVEDDSSSPCNWDIDRADIWINAPPFAEAGEPLGTSMGTTVHLDGNRSFDPDGKITRFQWDFGDGSSAEGPIADHVYHTSGSFEVTLTVVDDANAPNSTTSDSIIVFVNNPPTAVAGPDRTVAVGTTSIFDASQSTDSDGQIFEYEWDFGNNRKAKGKIVPFAYDRPGKYEVTLTVRDNFSDGSGIGQDSLQVIVNAPPIAEAGENQVVTTSEVSFDGTKSSDPDGGNLKYIWDFGDGTKSTDPAPKHVYKSPGQYVTTLTVMDESGTVSETTYDQVLVEVNQRPVADAGPSQVAAPGQDVHFNGFDSYDADGEIIQFDWDFGDASQASGQKVKHAYEKPGTYTVNLTVRDNTKQAKALDYDQTIVKVNAPPIANAGPDLLAAPGDMLSFSGQNSFDPDGKIISYHWVFSDTDTSVTGSEQRHSFAQPGFYTARLTVTDSSGASNSRSYDEVRIHINQQPKADPGQDIVTCDGAIQFDGLGSVDADGDALTYFWDFGDGTSALGSRVRHVFSEGGVYPVTLKVDDGTGLSNSNHSSAITVSINQPPIAKAGPSRTVCAGEVVLFDGSGSQDPDGGPLRYDWSFDDAGDANIVNPTMVFEKGGVYTVTLTVEDDSGLPCNSNTDQIIIKVAESPTAIAGPDLNVCANTRVRFDGTASHDSDGVVNRFQWDFADGDTGGGPTPEHIFTQPGTYNVLLTVTGDQNGDCDNTDTDEVTVIVNKAPEAKISGPEVVPINQEIAFNASQSLSENSQIIAWKWDFENSSTTKDKAKNQNEGAATDPGDESPEITGDEQISEPLEGDVVGSKEDNDEIPSNQVPPNSESDELTELPDRDHPLVMSNQESGEVVTHIFDEPGRHLVTLTITTDITGACKEVSTQQVVLVNLPPEANAGEDMFVGVNELVFFDGSKSIDADGAISSYQWDFGDGNNAQGVRVGHRYSESGHYTVTLTVMDDTFVANNTKTDTLEVHVNSAPQAQIMMKNAVCIDEEVQFSGLGTVDKDLQDIAYSWDFGDGAKADGPEVKHTYLKPGSYQVILTVDDGSNVNNSKQQTTQTVVVNIPPVVDAGPDQWVCPNQSVSFDGSKSLDPENTPLAFHWDFGDGSSADGSQVKHVFIEDGTFEVRLSVTDSSGADCNTSHDMTTVFVNKAPQAIAAEIGPVFAGGAHDAVLFDASPSVDPDGDNLTYMWEFGDGTKHNGIQVFHAFRDPGSYTVRLTVKDSSGLPCGQNMIEIPVEVKARNTLKKDD